MWPPMWSGVFGISCVVYLKYIDGSELVRDYWFFFFLNMVLAILREF